VNDDEHSLFMALGLIIVTHNAWKKRLNPFIKLHEASEVLSFSKGLSGSRVTTGLSQGGQSLA